MSSDSGRFTVKQIEVMEVIMKGTETGDFLDMDQLIERVSYNVSKAAMQCTVKFLLRRGMVERKPRELRRGRIRAVIGLTMTAIRTFDTSTGQFDIVIEGEDLEEISDK